MLTVQELARTFAAHRLGAAASACGRRPACDTQKEWRRPIGILCVRDRLYLTEEYDPVWDYDEEERPEGYSPEMARRVFVMPPAGEALQTYDLELEAGRRISGAEDF